MNINTISIFTCAMIGLVFNASAADIAPTALNYGTNILTFKLNSPSTSVAPSFSEGMPTSYTSSSALPTGLTLGANGVISGTATQERIGARFQITAKNSAGSTNVIITVNVVQNLAAPANIAYQNNILNLKLGTPMTPIKITNTGGVATSYSTSSALPTGLSLDSTGALSGTPATPRTGTRIQITASNSLGSARVIVTFNIQASVQITKPTAPTQLSAHASVNQINLVWLAPTSSSGTISYQISKGFTGDSTKTTIATVSGLSFTDNFLPEQSEFNRSFTYTVTAVNSAGASPQSNEASSIPQLTIPAAYFGMTVLNDSIKPLFSTGAARSWDVSNLSWPYLEKTKGKFDFTLLDKWIANHAGKELLYNLALTPQWASNQPTNSIGYYGVGQCAAPSDLADYDLFISTLVKHVAGKIKYFELSNEPNDIHFFCGTSAELVTMAKHASQVIKSIDPTAKLIGPATTGGPNGTSLSDGARYLSTLLAGGLGQYIDIYSFHGYWSHEGNDIATDTAQYRSVLASANQNFKPVWDTEASWSDFANPIPASNMQARAAYVAKYYLLHWSEGLSRLYWYAYDAGDVFGQLWDSTKGLHQDGIAFREVYGWMVGSVLTSPCAQDSNSTYTCNFKLSNGSAAMATWNSGKNIAVTVPNQFVFARDLAGNKTAVINHQITVGTQPVLLVE